MNARTGLLRPGETLGTLAAAPKPDRINDAERPRTRIPEERLGPIPDRRARAYAIVAERISTMLRSSIWTRDMGRVRADSVGQRGGDDAACPSKYGRIRRCNKPATDHIARPPRRSKVTLLDTITLAGLVRKVRRA
jgi:hypothetical protein